MSAVGEGEWEEEGTQRPKKKKAPKRSSLSIVPKKLTVSIPGALASAPASPALVRAFASPRVQLPPLTNAPALRLALWTELERVGGAPPPSYLQSPRAQQFTRIHANDAFGARPEPPSLSSTSSSADVWGDDDDYIDPRLRTPSVTPPAAPPTVARPPTPPLKRSTPVAASPTRKRERAKRVWAIGASAWLVLLTAFVVWSTTSAPQPQPQPQLLSDTEVARADLAAAVQRLDAAVAAYRALVPVPLLTTEGAAPPTTALVMATKTTTTTTTTTTTLVTTPTPATSLPTTAPPETRATPPQVDFAAQIASLGAELREAARRFGALEAAHNETLRRLDALSGAVDGDAIVDRAWRNATAAQFAKFAVANNDATAALAGMKAATNVTLEAHAAALVGVKAAMNATAETHTAALAEAKAAWAATANAHAAELAETKGALDAMGAVVSALETNAQAADVEARLMCVEAFFPDSCPPMPG